MTPERTQAQAQANAQWAATLLDALALQGLREVIASPGARSTPLILAAQAHPLLRLRLLTDERVAAFVALGAARASGRPTALIATSGSAGAHWLPALIEAAASGIGLLALTANRPHELSECGAPQAVPQRHFFADQVAWARALPAPGPEPDPLELRALETLAARAWASASGAAAAPVHLDLAFREPLWLPGVGSAPGGARAESGGPAPAPRRARSAPPRFAPAEVRLAPAALDALASELGGLERGWVVCGPDAAGPSPAAARAFAPAARDLARALGWPLVCDAASGLRSGEELACGEALARALGGDPAWTPSAVLRFGRPPVHKTLASLAARAPRQWAVDAAGRTLDPTHSAEAYLPSDARALACELSARLAPPLHESEWTQGWRAAEVTAREALSVALQSERLWGGGLAATLAEALPAGARLHVASSMAIRDLDAFWSGSALQISCSRGANGIDGTISTACGAALATGEPVTVLCGDLAFLHDLGGLAALRGLGVRLRVVVADNRGGGIFSYLPVSQSDAFEECFLTPPAADLGALARACGAEHRLVTSRSELSAALAAPAPTLEVIQAVFERAACEALHARAWAAVREALAPREVSASAVGSGAGSASPGGAS